MIGEKTYVYGKHAVTEALLHTPFAIETVLLEHTFDDHELKGLVRKNNIKIGSFASVRLPREIEEEANHQGIIASVVVSKLVKPYEEFIQSLSVSPHTALVILGEIQDPQNVGAIIRSAAAFGISGILLPEHRQAPITGAVVKVSAGMAFRIPLVEVGNINNTVRDLKQRGFWIYGLEGEGGEPIQNEKFDAPTAIIVGNESKGIREKTKEICDVLLRIPMNPQCESLNAAASAAVALYAWSVKHPEAL